MKCEYGEKLLWAAVQDRETKDTTQIKQQLTVLLSHAYCAAVF
jgi:hypothetical protein